MPPAIKFSPSQNEGGYDQWTLTPLTQCTFVGQHPPFSLKLIQSQNLPQQASQVKKLTIEGIYEFHIIFKGKGVV